MQNSRGSLTALAGDMDAGFRCVARSFIFLAGNRAIGMENVVSSKVLVGDLGIGLWCFNGSAVVNCEYMDTGLECGDLFTLMFVGHHDVGLS